MSKERGIDHTVEHMHSRVLGGTGQDAEGGGLALHGVDGSITC